MYIIELLVTLLLLTACNFIIKSFATADYAKQQAYRYPLKE
jgi:hypothetical protein